MIIKISISYKGLAYNSNSTVYYLINKTCKAETIGHGYKHILWYVEIIWKIQDDSI